MLLCMMCGTDVIVPIHMLFSRFTFSSTLGRRTEFCPRYEGDCISQYSLIRVGLFTLMYIDSLMVLARLLSSLPIILKLFKVVSWPLLF